MMHKKHMEDTIAAIATAPGEGGVAIIRISGPQSLSIADEVFRCRGPKPSERPSHVILHGRIVSTTEDLDETLLLVMRAPHSYTGEDVVEIQGHGGIVPARRILRRVLDAGARPAEPGEFTRRAFINGRMDLTQAEAVLDLIRSRTDRAAAAALEQLEGALSRRMDALYEELITAAADLEATLDFPEEELPTAVMPDISARISMSCNVTNKMLATWEEGHILRDGAVCVITGKTNVGKSTMLNTLLGRCRAIVSQRHGTTRDSIEESFVIDGFPIRLIDTAGLRPSDCEIELEGMRRAKELIQKADLRIHMIDSSVHPDDSDRLHLSELDPGRSIVVLNKTDLGDTGFDLDTSRFKTIKTSLLNEFGLDEIKSAILEKLCGGIDLHAPPHAVISERHRVALVEAKKEMDCAVDLLSGSQEDKAVLAAQHLRLALEKLGGITGRVYQDELLNAVFSRFCIGK